jgi:hypothetical protein
MPEQWSDYVAALIGALAVGYLVYQIDRRRRKLHEVFDVLDADDVSITKELEDLAACGELQPYAGTALA